jgi:hypothetical protein
MLGRRGLIAGFAAVLAAPAVVRTPGLLMPVRSVPSLSLTEWASRHSNGLINREIIELLSRSNDLLAEMPWVETPTLKVSSRLWQVGSFTTEIWSRAVLWPT